MCAIASARRRTSSISSSDNAHPSSPSKTRQRAIEIAPPVLMLLDGVVRFGRSAFNQGHATGPSRKSGSWAPWRRGQGRQPGPPPRVLCVVGARRGRRDAPSLDGAEASPTIADVMALVVSSPRAPC